MKNTQIYFPTTSLFNKITFGINFRASIILGVLFLLSSMCGYAQNTMLVFHLINTSGATVSELDKGIASLRSITTNTTTKGNTKYQKNLKSGTIYDINPDASEVQIASVAAMFNVLEQKAVNTITKLNSNIELYKLEKGSDVRSFSIPSGQNTATLIPIKLKQIYGTKGIKMGWYNIDFPSGYLQPGEYAFIDKLSMSTNGSTMACFTFSINP